MNKKLVVMSGVSGSGKTTIARNWVAKEPLTAYVERDMLRQTIFHAEGKTVLSNEKEQIVTERQIAEVKELFRCGFQTVIISDTNLSWKYVNNWKALAQELGVGFEHMKIEVSLKTALERNENRPVEEQVPASVIKRQYSKYLQVFGKVENRPLMVSSEKELCIISDLDGTLELMNGRSPYDSMKCDTDMPNSSVVIAVKAMVIAYPNVKFIAVSGREDKAFDKTYDSLCSYGIEPDALLMRETGDSRSDVLVKQDIYREFIEPFYNVLFVYDDRKIVVEQVWRELGLHCFQVAYGDF